MEIHTIGIDLGKTVFHLVGLNQRGEVVVRKKFSRKQLLHFTMRRRSPRPWGGRRCASYRSRAMINWICSRCIGTCAARLNSTPVVANRADRGGFPLLGCMLTLYRRVSLIILNENSARHAARSMRNSSWFGGEALRSRKRRFCHGLLAQDFCLRQGGSQLCVCARDRVPLSQNRAY